MGIPCELRIVMRVDVDDPRCEDTPGGVNLFDCGPVRPSDLHDSSSLNREIGRYRRARRHPSTTLALRMIRSCIGLAP